MTYPQPPRDDEIWKATGRDRERLLATFGHQPTGLYSAQDIVTFVSDRVRWATGVMVGEGPLHEYGRPLPKYKTEKPWDASSYRLTADAHVPIFDTAVHVHVLLPRWMWIGCGLVHWWLERKLWRELCERTPVGLRVFVVVR